MTPAEIKAIRKRMEWTQQQMADALDVSVRTVKHWESGSRNMSKPLKRLLRLITNDS